MVVQGKRKAAALAMLSNGNSKLGRDIYSFSIPAEKTCPGATEHCLSNCYARSGRFHMPAVQDRYSKNLKLIRRDDFVDNMVFAIRAKRVRILRVHVSGDFLDTEYIRDWREIALKCRDTTFFSYTRSWRVTDLLTDLVRLSRLPNWQMWFSVDRETGPAPHVEGVRHAYMCIDPLDELIAPQDVDLVFRERDKTVQKKMEGVQVCPVENGVSYAFKMTCSRCSICWKGPRQ